MPVSSLTCTRPPPGAATQRSTNASRQATTSASASSATGSSSSLSAPITSDGAVDPAGAQLARLLRGGDGEPAAPPASAARAAATAPWP